MKDPILHLGLTVNGDRVSLTMTRSDGGGIPSYANWDLRDVESEGYLALCQRIGNIALRKLADAHPAEFARHPLLVPPKESHDDPVGVVTSLIHRSVVQKTTAYIAAIDIMFETDAAAMSYTNLNDIWRDTRANLIASYGPKQQ